MPMRIDNRATAFILQLLETSNRIINLVGVIQAGSHVDQSWVEQSLSPVAPQRLTKFNSGGDRDNSFLTPNMIT